jgi:ElaA protein
MTTAPSIVEWTTKSFDQLTVDELYEVLQLRQAVFVVEQQCWYLDADGVDRQSLHLLGRLPSGQLACYLRIVPPGHKFNGPSIGRVVVDNSVRRHRIGTSLMTRGIELVEERYPTFGIALSAQKYLEHFYRSFGFTSTGHEYLEDGIPHVDMYRPRRGIDAS